MRAPCFMRAGTAVRDISGSIVLTHHTHDLESETTGQHLFTNTIDSPVHEAVYVCSITIDSPVHEAVYVCSMRTGTNCYKI